jgi:hypothetical protein
MVEFTRVPAQQGQAFFTATPAPPKVSLGGGGGLSKTAAAVARRLQAARGAADPNQPGGAVDESAPQEEIVGVMEEAVGDVAPSINNSRTSINGRKMHGFWCNFPLDFRP